MSAYRTAEYPIVKEPQLMFKNPWWKPWPKKFCEEIEGKIYIFKWIKRWSFKNDQNYSGVFYYTTKGNWVVVGPWDCPVVYAESLEALKKKAIKNNMKLTIKYLGMLEASFEPKMIVEL